MTFAVGGMCLCETVCTYVCESTYVCMCVHVCVDCAIQRETSRQQMETVLSWQDSGPAWSTQQNRSGDTAYGKYFALISTPRNPPKSRLAPLCTQDRVCVLTTGASPGEVSGEVDVPPTLATFSLGDLEQVTSLL